MSVSETAASNGHLHPRHRTRRLRDVVAVVGAFAVTAALYLVWGPAYAACFLLPFAFTWRVVPFLAPRLLRRGVFVLPGGRAIHGKRIPLLGGAAIAVPLVVVLVALAFLGDLKAAGLAAGTAILVLVGAYDDIRGVRPAVKIGGQLLAGFCLLLTGFRLDALAVAGLGEWSLGALGPACLLLWILVASNALNLTDGLDGLAGSMALVGCAAAFSFGIHPVAAVAAGGGTLGFLRHNFPPARIFLGDAGSLPLGFLLGAFALEAPVAANVPIAVAILGYSLGDLVLTVSRRVVRGKPLFAGDQSHVHHKLLDRLGSVRRVLAFVVPLALAHALMAVQRPDLVSVAFWAVSWAALALGLVFSGQVKLRRMFRNRTHFRELHATRRRVAGALRRARGPHEVEAALRSMVEALGLSSLSIGHLHLRGRHDGNGSAVRVPVPLRSRHAEWAYPAAAEERTLDLERRAVVCDLLRAADEQMGRPSGTGARRRRDARAAQAPNALFLDEVDGASEAVGVPGEPR